MVTVPQRRRTANPDDPRVRRTLKLLGDTLIALIEEKGYDAVTIQDITDRAQVSRTTFYLHFRDKDELLFENMRAIYDDLATISVKVDFNDPAAVEAALCEPTDFEHVQKYVSFYRVMLSDKGSMTFYLRVMEYLATVMSATMIDGMDERRLRIPLPLLAHMAAGAEIGLIMWWINHDLPYTPAQMARFLYDAQMNGIWWALGMAEAPRLTFEQGPG
ncbi:MAG: TetR/AcrR family transcriptional regulator [bacterium]|nr:TetR/AcrR family transcriptional regulator [bacterium]